MPASLAFNGTFEGPTDSKGPTGQLCNWLEKLALKDVPGDAQARAKALVLDGVACALVGAQLPWSRTAVEAILRIEGTGNKTIIGWNRTASGPVAALLNGTFIQGFELDDFHPGGPLHSAAVVIPSLLACAEELGQVTGKDFLLAAIAGFEVGPRVGMALHGAQMLSRGWHSGSVFGTHASAVAAGKLLGLDAARFEDAVGLAGTQSAGLMAAQFEAMCKRMHHGFSARNGLYSALLAASGYTGIKRVFEREYGGFLSVFGEGHDPDASQITRGLGDRWETNRIAIKPYAAMGALHAPLDAIFDIMDKRPFKSEEIEHIDIYMSHSAYHHGWWVLERPLTPIGAQMNVGYAVAVAILDGAAMVRQFAPQRIDGDDVWALIPRITAHHDPEFDKGGPSVRNTRMVVRLKNGEKIEHFVEMARTIGQPLTNSEVARKYRMLTDGIIDPKRQAAIEDRVMNLEKMRDVTELAALLGTEVGAAFK
ncbi:MmgE/PrpD family protein [Bradyrhizobium sp. LHD-71]|uniref:MmgE/PrpD family protein n=1 Tax=Bradyrhizobium sp. LHD-71 TaxID=3072141 RepID=UPI00280DFB7F|nr:MmgE/PrpD family protein [Bradyrhizobium sp. LHD-71]MDQ8729143.1 MmgE/PrpD family protein [Bradyrhizobium sp. LHD-71]